MIKNTIIGAIIGDISGSYYQFDPIKTKDYPFFQEGCTFTDDTVMTIAVAKALRREGDLKENVIGYMREFGRRYPDAGYGAKFAAWLADDTMGPYGSYGNGAAMRISPVGFFARSEEECSRLSKIVTEVTHNSLEGVCAAEAVALAIYLARTGASKEKIRSRLDGYYDFNFTLDEIRGDYSFDCSCDESVPQAIQCFFESDCFEDAIRNAVSLGGDSATQAAIAGGIAGAYYHTPSALILGAEHFLPQEMIDTVELFNRTCEERGNIMEKKKMEAHDFAELIYGKKIRSKSTNIEGYGKRVMFFLYGCTVVGIVKESDLMGTNHFAVSLPDIEFVDCDTDCDLDFSAIEITYENDHILGALCKDIVSGFEGIAEEVDIQPGRSDSVSLQPKAREDNSVLPERHWFDYGRIRKVEQAVTPEEVKEPERTGGIMDDRDLPDRMIWA